MFMNKKYVKNLYLEVWVSCDSTESKHFPCTVATRGGGGEGKALGHLAGNGGHSTINANLLILRNMYYIN